MPAVISLVSDRYGSARRGLAIQIIPLDAGRSEQIVALESQKLLLAAVHFDLGMLAMLPPLATT